MTGETKPTSANPPTPANGTPPAADPAAAKDEYETDPDVLAQLAQVFWLDDQIEAGKMIEYEGKHVAVFENRVLGADKDAEALLQRLLAENPDHPFHRTVIRYVPGLDDIYW
jgi:hypothetical protein